VLVDRFLDDAIEVDVDALYDGDELYLGGVMEHIEEAGIHSGDSSCALPPITLGREDIDRIRESTRAIADGVGVRGLINIQFAVASDVLYVLEANPRASRTVPFVSKATNTPLAKAAARIMLGHRSPTCGPRASSRATGDGADFADDAPVAVKEAVLPFNRFRTADGTNVDTILGPEMRSTGEVMGFDSTFGMAFAKAQSAAFGGLPSSGRAFVSVANRDKRHMIFPIKRLADLGFEILATAGTAEVLRRNGVPATVVRKHSDRTWPGWRTDDRRAHPCRRGRSGDQYPTRDDVRRIAATGRIRDPDSIGGQQHRLYHHCPGACRDGSRHRGTAGGHPRRQVDPELGRRPRVTSTQVAARGPLQVKGEVFSLKRVGEYYHLTVVADRIAERTKPGNFVALAVGG
jgi:hypothetical protein